MKFKVEVKLEVSIRSLKLKIKVEVWSCLWILSEYLKLKFEVDIDSLKRSLKFIFYADINLISIHVNIWLFSIWGGVFLPFWGNWGLGSTTLLWPSYVGNQLIIYIFEFAPFLAFLPFLGLSGLFFGLWSGSKKIFGTS